MGLGRRCRHPDSADLYLYPIARGCYTISKTCLSPGTKSHRRKSYHLPESFWTWVQSTCQYVMLPELEAPVASTLGVGEAQKRFSELVGRAAYK